MSNTRKAKTLLSGKCWHEIVPRRLEPDEYGSWGGAKCLHCDDWTHQYQAWGWYCPHSPDHLCHYYSQLEPYTNNRYIISVNGEKIYLKKHHKHQYETSDQCLFCGMPEERK